MAEPRRAADTPNRRKSKIAIVALAVLTAAAVAVGVSLSVRSGQQQAAPGDHSATGASRAPGATSSATNPTPGPSGTESTSPSPSASGTASGSASSSADAGKLLDSCAAQAEAAEQLIGAGRTGISHWNGHVQAQTDHLAGRISRSRMEAIFKETKLKGPDDQRAWTAAQKAWSKAQHGRSCEDTDGVDPTSAATLTGCAERLTALQTAMPAAEDAMNDWLKHLAAMKRSAAGLDKDPMGTWMATWRAAPPHLKAWQAADAKLQDVPVCRA